MHFRFSELHGNWTRKDLLCKKLNKDYASSTQLGNSERGSGKNDKTSICGHFRPKRPILDIFGQNDQNSENYQKSVWKILV